MDTIKIENVKGISSLTFEIPTNEGVYLLTGLNGCGKTTLLVALARIYDSKAFAINLKVGGATGLDAIRNGRFTYNIGGQEVVYRHREKRWTPTPKSKSELLANCGLFSRIVYIATDGARSYMQEPKNMAALRPVYQNVSNDIKNTMNFILDTNKFDNLRFIQLDMRGRRHIPHRENKLYSVVTPGHPTYTERNFSLGERFVLNMLDIIDGIPDNSLLLIDEIELALHPAAQIKFYDYLKQVSAQKHLTVIISTHSSSLIRHSDQTLYLENNNGIVTVLNDCFPAYILKDLSPWEDRHPDYLFFVEDVQARFYLSELLAEFQRRENNNAEVCVLPVAGKKQTVEYMLNNNGVGTNTLRNMQCFPDYDVYTELQQNIANYPNLPDSQRDYTDMMVANDANITYLDITPELGLWTELHVDSSFLESALVVFNGGNPLVQRMSTIIAQVDAEEAGRNIGNPRKHAKFAMKNLLEKIQAIVAISESDLWRIIWKSYVQHKTDDLDFYSSWKSKFDAIFAR